MNEMHTDMFHSMTKAVVLESSIVIIFWPSNVPCVFSAGADLNYFWQWTDMTSFIIATCAIFIFFAAVTLCFAEVELYTELIGTVALLLEANLGTPQIWHNYRRKSTVGLSYRMTLLWLVSDILKTIYFFMRYSPLQFKLCGFFQIFLDVILLSQIFIYWQDKKPNESSEV
ncbi:unnamed protein product [Soboliphyme baturini]|uniref:PQ-loop repeat-containing protein 1 n=1 Tax=Soboliphyme baturini TaxID=241478 RepID=A0A183I9P0_9BILA|nr:unnamed protein product [Soboliphyme baturini]